MIFTKYLDETGFDSFNLVALLDFPNGLDSNGSNYDSETSHSVGVLTRCIHRFTATSFSM